MKCQKSPSPIEEVSLGIEWLKSLESEMSRLGQMSQCLCTGVTNISPDAQQT